MTRIRNQFNVFAFLSLLIAAGVAKAQPMQPTEGTNLAGGKSCTFDPPPSYPDCTDEGDAFDLTDGVYNGSIWNEKGTVGFQPGYGWDVESMPIFLVDIDLEDERPIGKITFSSVGGSAGVTFPSAVQVYVSTDAKQYDLLCIMLTDAVPQDQHLNHRFVADDLKGWGRHVRFALLPGGPLMFFDEIEIMEGTHTREEARRLNKKPIPAGMVKTYTKQMRTGVAKAQPGQSEEGTNLARGKMCTFDPPPSYPDCTDEGDPFDLTDGIYNGCAPYAIGTVGLQPGYGWDIEGMPISLIDIDLGDARPIGKITFDTITDSGGITFPLAVRVFVSTDAKQYDLLCTLLTDSVPQDQPLNHRFVSDDLKGWGRHVRFALLPGGPLMFFDEIEIMEGSHTREEARHLTKRPIPAGMVKIYAKQMRRGTPDLWSYSGFGSDRGEMTSSGYYYGEGMGGLKEKHPEFFRAARDINALLIRKSFLDERLRSAIRVQYYERNIAAADSQTGNLARDIEEFQNKSTRVNNELNDLFQFYGRAFDEDRSVEQLSGVESRIKDVADEIQRLETGIDDFVSKATSGVIAETGKWKRSNLELSPEERVLSDDGTNRRYQFTAFSGAHTEPLWPLGPFDGFHIDHPIPWPVSDTPGEYNFPKLRGYIERIRNESSGKMSSFSCTEPGWNGNMFPMTKWMLEKAGSDPDIILQTEKDKQAPVVSRVLIGDNSRLNYYHPAAREYIRGYLKSFAVELTSQTPVNYFMTAWEGAADHVGYNPSSQAAFREYLKERCGSIESLNGKWQTEYASFEAIEIPYEQYDSPAGEVSGLTYEFERWRRLNYVRLIADMRQYLREGAPNVPVMSDPSHFLKDGNTYLMYKEHACDIMSFHSNPALEDPMWVYLDTMNRAFGRITGYFENYFGMWSKAHLSDERLAKRDLYKFFFKMFLRDVRISAWWLGGVSHATSYVTAYNGNSFGLNYDQTIYRWSATALPVMFSRGRSIEKALLESRQEIPKTAIIQPCASVFNLASLNRAGNDSDALTLMFDLHNKLLGPENVPHDYLPEEMVLDGKGSLDDYTALFLPYAPYMSEELSGRLTRWVKKGGTLIAFGPFSLKNEFGLDLASGDSIYRTLFPKYKKVGAADWDYSVDGTDRIARPVATRSFGKGQVICLNRMLDVLLQDLSLKSLLTEIVKDACERTAQSPDSDLGILVREGEHGEKYLGLCNRNVEEPIETTVIISGKYENPMDILVPGWFPVPSDIYGDKTILRIRLAPGDWTLVQL